MGLIVIIASIVITCKHLQSLAITFLYFNQSMILSIPYYFFIGVRGNVYFYCSCFGWFDTYPLTWLKWQVWITKVAVSDFKIIDVSVFLHYKGYVCYKKYVQGETWFLILSLCFLSFHEWNFDNQVTAKSLAAAAAGYF